MEKNNKNCNNIYEKIIDANELYSKILKKNCITNSCRRRKEEMLGDLLNLYESLQYCSKKYIL